MIYTYDEQLNENGYSCIVGGPYHRKYLLELDSCIYHEEHYSRIRISGRDLSFAYEGIDGKLDGVPTITTMKDHSTIAFKFTTGRVVSLIFYKKGQNLNVRYRVQSGLPMLLNYKEHGHDTNKR